MRRQTPRCGVPCETKWMEYRQLTGRPADHHPVEWRARGRCDVSPEGNTVVKCSGQRRRRLSPGRRSSSKRTFNGLPPNDLPLRPAIAARASCPSISMKPKPRHRPLKTSAARRIERTVPNSENSARTESSLASSGRFPTNIFFKIKIL